MILARRAVGGVEVVSLPARLDATAAPEIRKELRAVIDGGRRHLLLDLSAITFMDSSGLSVLVTALKAARAAGGDVSLLHLTPPVQSLLELTRLHRVFSIFDGEDEALRRIGH
jgi:anti-sigma B factor antagonist